MKSKVPLRKKVLYAGIGVGLAAAGLMGGKKHLEVKQARIEREKVAITQNFTRAKMVRNPSNWAKLCVIYGWNPARTNDIKVISKMEQLSKRISYSPAEIMRTVYGYRGEISRGKAEAVAKRLYERSKYLSGEQKETQIKVVNVLQWAHSNPADAKFIFSSPKMGTGKQLSELISEWN